VKELAGHDGVIFSGRTRTDDEVKLKRRLVVNSLRVVLDATLAGFGIGWLPESMLTGPTAITLHEVAAAISAKLGKPVKYQPVPTSAALEQMASFGLDDFNIVAMRDYFDSYTNG